MKKELGTAFETSFNYKIKLRHNPEDLTSWSLSFRFLWLSILGKVWREKNQQDETIRCLLLTSISKCFGHHYAHLQENKEPVTAFGVLFCNKRENLDISRDVFFVG